MKAILMSIKPQYVAKILNGEKTIEIRKKFPKDYVGWVYIYCTKGNKNECLIADLQPDKVYHPLTEKLYRGVYSIIEEKAIWNDCKKYILNGKVVARFWCDKVEPTYKFYVEELCQLACISKEELYKYAGGWYKTDDLLAIHITKLETFDKPKEISGFRKPIEYTKYCNRDCSNCNYAGFNNKTQKWEFECSLTRAPQNYCYIEL